MQFRHARWNDNDQYFGPFTYSRDARDGYRSWAIELSSGDNEYRGCQLRFSGFSRTLIIALPPIVRPWLEEFGEPVDAAMAARIGRKRHYRTHRRVFGFSLSNSGRVGGGVDFLIVRYGAQTNDSRTDMDWGYFLPWASSRHVRHSVYGLAGEHFADMPSQGRYIDTLPEREAIEAACPTRTFSFTDFDGEVLTAKTSIEEREWRHGTGWFKWLSWFRKPIIQRALKIEFSGETGERKGSWKGGTTGTGIGMLPGELHEAAFRRYCEKHAMTFIS